MPELIDIDPIIICPNTMKCTKRKPTVKSPDMIRVQPIVRCPEKLKCPPSFRQNYKPRSPGCSGGSCVSPTGYKSRRGYSPSYKLTGYSPTGYKLRGYSPTGYKLRGYSPSLQHGGIIIIHRN